MSIEIMLRGSQFNLQIRFGNPALGHAAGHLFEPCG
jgi:hypothetical protein